MTLVAVLTLGFPFQLVHLVTNLRGGGEGGGMSISAGQLSVEVGSRAAFSPNPDAPKLTTKGAVVPSIKPTPNPCKTKKCFMYLFHITPEL